MNPTRAIRITLKDLRLGPRSPIFLWALVLPLLMTFLISAVFGDLLDPDARLAIVDQGASELTAEARLLDGIEVDELDDVSRLRRAVEDHDYDAGIILPADFDARLRTGEQPELQFLVSGQSLASNRLILAITTLDLVRDVADQTPPVEVVVTTVGDEDYVPIGDRLLPLIVVYAVVIAGLFLPAASLLDEREKRTLDAMLVSPTRMADVLLGKGILGVILGLGMGLVTLALNRAFGGRPFDMVVFLLIGGIMLAEVGLMLGSWARDSNTLFSAIKGGGILVMAPVIFNIFPDLPQWIAQLFPTYYFLQPIYEIATTGSTLGDHWTELLVGLAVCLVLLPGVIAVGRTAERKSAITV